MSTYKVIQDVEAEDKLLGPLSFRQFVYALIAVFMLYIGYISYTKQAAYILVITIPIMLFTGFLAFPFGKDQPTEVWALAKLRFLLKPRKRIWAQSGVKELVTITVPKRVEVDLTNGLTQNEVKSRLQALANTIDSRGWVVKNVIGIYQNPVVSPDSDRLISAAVAQNVPDDNISAAEDVLDEQANPVAQQMEQLINDNGNFHRQQLMQTLSQIRANPGQNVMASQPSRNQNMASTPAPNPTPAPTVDEAGILNELKNLNVSQHTPLNNMRTLKTAANKSSMPTNLTVPTSQTNASNQPAIEPSTTAPDPVIMNLSTRNDLNVTVIAHEANKAKTPKKSASGDEVLISLH